MSEKYVRGFIIANVYFYTTDYCTRVLKFILPVKKEVNVFLLSLWECFYGGIKANKRLCIYSTGKWLIKLVLLRHSADDTLTMLYYTSISTLNLLKKKYYKNFNKWPKSLLIQKVTPNFKLPSFKKEEIGSLEEHSAVYFTSKFFIQCAGRTGINE